jgi:DNA-binding NtrC family response regulator
MQKILIVEDEEIIRNSLKKLLARNNYEVSEAGSVDEARELQPDQFDLVISDLRLPGGQGTDLIEAASPRPVMIMTSYASTRSAVDAMKLGAVDYIAKPFDHNEMVDMVKRILSEAPATTVVREEKSKQGSSGKAQIIGNSSAMGEVFTNIEQVAPTDATVLICGETGTGKELVARTIHEKSPRSTRPLITVNCASIPEGMIEAELFGRDQGNEQDRGGLIVAADGGTLFLDEIGELPLEAQARLLRVLQDNEIRPLGAVESRQVDLRLIAATHRDLKQLCAEGLFREDLYFRINVFQINLPPLRDRGEDIVDLSRELVEITAARLGKPAPELPQETLNALLKHSWPGNVRELQNAIERALIINDGNQPIRTQDLELVKSTTGEMAAITDVDLVGDMPDPERLSLDDYFKKFVLENQNNLSETELAKRLGISRKNLWERRQKLGIPRKKTGR